MLADFTVKLKPSFSTKFELYSSKNPFDYRKRVFNFHFWGVHIADEITKSKNLKIGGAIFRPVEQNSGGYRSIDARGYQFMINYRAGKQIAPRLTLAEVLVENRLTPELVKDRIVLIKTTDKTFKDFHRTPYSRGDFLDVPGVVIQAHMVSQIVSAVKDKRP